MIVKNFKVDPIQKLFLKSLLGDSLSGLYAPQCIKRIEEDGNATTFLGDKVFFTTQTKKLVRLDQYSLEDSSLISESSNLKMQVENARLIDFQPNFLNQGFYLDYMNGKISGIEIFANLSYQLDEDNFSEICIKDEKNKIHHFIHIECEYILRFHLENQLFNLMLSNERYFSGSNDFTARFRILEDSEANTLINSVIYSSENGDITYEKVFSTSE